MIGKSIAHYRVTEMLGKGGMGEVYRATDTKLGREVALKVLPPVFANDSQRMARFKREAHVLASLNHPNIASIYGLEESDGVHCLVLELVEGPTRAERIREGAVPLEEALNIAKQIAEALEAAHEKGVIHRDLKPANVKVTPEGMVKVLDFGLAKAMADEATQADALHSRTGSIMPTHEGVILGTAGYMSPEQARGQEADKRADIWAFGVVLFEMLTGKQSFKGETTSDTLASVLKLEPDWEALPSGTPVLIQRLLCRCLEKDRKRRLHDIADARIEIDETLADPSGMLALPAGTIAGQPAWRRTLPWAVAGMLTVALFALWWAPKPKPEPPMRLSVEVAPGESLWTEQGPAAVISPDGTRLAFVTTDGQGQRKLYVRPLDQLQATVISGTEGAANPFFSPDGEWIAFFAENKLKKISVVGGAAVTLCDASIGRGGSLSKDGTIIFAPTAGSGLSRISSAGGVPEAVTTLDKEKGETSHRWPQVLPGGKVVLFTVLASSVGEPYIEVQSLETGERKTLQQAGIYGRYLPTGHLAYVRERTLFAAPFDLGRLEVTGPPVPIVEDVEVYQSRASAQFDFSQTGTLVYLTGEGATAGVSIFWMDQEGKMDPLLSTPRNYGRIRLSPDGRRLAMGIREGSKSDIWVYDLERGALSRLTFNEGVDPVWTPDGRYVTFGSNRQGGAARNIYWKRADGAGEAQRLTESEHNQPPNSWSPDGKTLAFMQISPQTSRDLWTLPMEEDGAGGLKPGKPVPFLITPFSERTPAFSPDGRWVAYYSDESGGYEVYVRPFPGPGGKWQISTDGGRFPTWSPNGGELFYRTLDSRIMAVTYSVEGDSFRVGRPRLWSEEQFPGRGSTQTFDLHPDGKRFALLKAAEDSEQTGSTHMNLVTNWFDEVRRRVASAGQN